MSALPKYDPECSWRAERIPDRPVMRVIDVQRQDTYFDLPLMVTFNGSVQGPAYLRLDVDEVIDLVDELNLALDVRVREPVAKSCTPLSPDARRADPCTCGPRRGTGWGVVLTGGSRSGRLLPSRDAGSVTPLRDRPGSPGREGRHRVDATGDSTSGVRSAPGASRA